MVEGESLMVLAAGQRTTRGAVVGEYPRSCMCVVSAFEAEVSASVKDDVVGVMKDVPRH